MVGSALRGVYENAGDHAGGGGFGSGGIGTACRRSMSLVMTTPCRLLPGLSRLLYRRPRWVWIEGRLDLVVTKEPDDSDE